MTMPSWPLAVSSWSWHAPYYAGRWSLLDLPASATAADLSLLECNDFMLPPPRLSRLRQPLLRLLPGAPPELWRYSRQTLSKLRTAAAEHNCRLLTWTINSDFVVSPLHWPAQQLYLRRGLAAARGLGVPLLRLNLGGQPETPPAQDALVEQRLLSFAHTALMAAPHLSLTVENHWGLSTDIDRHLRLVGAVRAALPPALRPRFGCCFDPSNMPDSPERSRWWAGLAPLANHYHFKTTTFDESGNDPTLPHARLLALLAQAGYQGQVTLEYQGDAPPLPAVRQSAALYHSLL